LDNNSLHKRAIEIVQQKATGKANDNDYTITINFHPDRLTIKKQPLLLAIADDGLIKSQFETGTSNGGLTAYHGGERWLWEQQVFNGIYNNALVSEKPKYGALNYRKLATGASNRFGSAYFCLKSHILKRSTFCYPDSYFMPENFATIEYIEALINELENGNLDQLDTYIEAQIHGDILINNDIECLVMDPVYKGTEIEYQASKLPFDIYWHSGYELSVKQIERYPDYRGQEIISISKEIAVNNRINPQIIGLAHNDGRYDIQDIKKVWHYLARYGYRGYENNDN